MYILRTYTLTHLCPDYAQSTVMYGERLVVCTCLLHGDGGYFNIVYKFSRVFANFVYCFSNTTLVRRAGRGRGDRCLTSKSLGYNPLLLRLNCVENYSLTFIFFSFFLFPFFFSKWTNTWHACITVFKVFFFYLQGGPKIVIGTIFCMP